MIVVLPIAAAGAVAAVAYALLVRWGVWRWLAGLVALPVLAPVLLAPGDEAAYVPLLLTSVAVVLLGWRSRPPMVLVTGGLVLAALATASPSVAGVTGWEGSVAGPGDSPGPGLLLFLLLSAPIAMAVAGAGRSGGSGLRLVCATTAGVPAVVVLLTALLPGAGQDAVRTHGWAVLAWYPAAGALALTALTRGRRSAAATRPQSDEVDLAASRAFDRRYRTPRLESVVVVIAAYNEAGGIREVLRTLPRTVCDLPVDVLVVDDGSSDDTAAQTDDAGRAYLVACAQNRGQGAALRLGYRIAAAHGARYLITTDADGQYDAADLPVVLAPLLSGKADFVTGSRLLGHQQTRDRVRRLGVHVFAWLVSALVGRRLTDTSFGLRAMRTEVTETVTLNQPQYQSSELLIGAVSHGFAVLEVPGTMRVRGAGASKKGGNLVYGRSYAGVVLTTWWREGCPAPVAERAPALRGSVATPAR